MRTTSILAATLALLSTASATPNWARPLWPWWKSQKQCMTDDDANTVAGVFQQLIQGYTIEMALAVLTEGFVDYSSAVSIVINKGASVPEDVTAPIFTSRAEFMAGHGKQKPIPFETLGVWHNCETVSMKWKTVRSGQGQPTEAAAIPVIGLVILETEPAEEGNTFTKFRIHTIHSEFNTAAWLVNLGVFDPVNETTPVPAAKRDTMAISAPLWTELNSS